MQERRRLPDGFLLMLLSHHFVVAFLVLTTFVVEPAVYNFMQTQKERKPCKIKASATNKKSARRGSKPFPPLQGFSNGLPVETLQRGEVDPSASLAIMFLSCQKLGSRRRRQYYPQLLRHETLYHNPPYIVYVSSCLTCFVTFET